MVDVTTPMGGKDSAALVHGIFRMLLYSVVALAPALYTGEHGEILVGSHLDDLWAFAKSEQQNWKQLLMLLAAGAIAGAEYKLSKTEYPGQLKEIMGFLFDLLRKEVGLTLAKTIKLRKDTLAFLARGVWVALKDVQKLQGRWGWVGHLDRGVYSHLAPLIGAAKIAERHKHEKFLIAEHKQLWRRIKWHLQMILKSFLPDENSALRIPLRWAADILPELKFNMKPIKSCGDAAAQPRKGLQTVKFWTDASGFGMGGWINAPFSQFKGRSDTCVSAFTISWADMAQIMFETNVAPPGFDEDWFNCLDINQLEMLGTVYAAYLWKKVFTGRATTALTDNTQATAWLTRARGGAEPGDRLVSFFWCIQREERSRIRVQHIAGTRNPTADVLSRQFNHWVNLPGVGYKPILTPSREHGNRLKLRAFVTSLMKLPGLMQTWQERALNYKKQIRSGGRNKDFQIQWKRSTVWKQENPQWRDTVAKQKIEEWMTVQNPGYPEPLTHKVSKTQ